MSTTTKRLSIFAGSALIVLGVIGFLQINASVMAATEVNGPLMSSSLGLYFFAALLLVAYGALAGRKPRLP